MKRGLDGCYFRVKRDGRYDAVCFSDLTSEERDEVGKDRPAEWWKSLACHLADQLYTIGELFDISGDHTKTLTSDDE